MNTAKRIALCALAISLCGLGTARIQQPDGNVRVYKNVIIQIKDEAMAMTSSDHKGTIVLGKAACSKVAELIRCLPYDATLLQNGKSLHIPLQSGTVYLNPAKSAQFLEHSTTKLPPHGVLLTVRTKRGTYLSLSGIVDKVQK